MSEQEKDIEIEYGTHPWASKSTPEVEPDIVKHIRAVLQSDSGVELFRHIRMRCGVDRPIFDFNELGEPIVSSMMGKAAMQKFWFDLKELVSQASRDKLIEIEIPPRQE